MKINNELDLVKVMGWTQSSKIRYILNELRNNKDKEQIENELVNEYKVMKKKSFQNYWNKINRIEEDIKF